MKARRDFTDEAEYADYLKTYATIAAMQGVLAMYSSPKAPHPFEADNIARESVRIAEAVLHRLNK